MRLLRQHQSFETSIVRVRVEGFQAGLLFVIGSNFGKPNGLQQKTDSVSIG
jgi:hypothetical protein